MKRENERLYDENAALRAQLASLSQLAARAERLEKLLELRSQIHADTLAAQVIGVETSRQFRVLRVRLDLGGPLPRELGQVRPGQPVLSPMGAVVPNTKVRVFQLPETTPRPGFACAPGFPCSRNALLRAEAFTDADGRAQMLLPGGSAVRMP